MLLKAVKFLLIYHLYFLKTVISSGENDVEKLNQPLSREELNQPFSREELNQPISREEFLNAVLSSVEEHTEEDSPQEKEADEDSSAPDYDTFQNPDGRYYGPHITAPGFDLTPEEMEKFKIWENGVIPYYIDVVSFNDKVARDSIRSFLQSVNGMTSVSFVELPSPPSDDKTRFVMFMNRRGQLDCADHSVKDFTTKGVQKVVLGYNCMTTNGELAEAVMSIVGVPAQHNAPNRDKYITVNMENILPDKKYLFEKLEDRDWIFHDLEYDVSSITHYDYNKYSANGHVTIEPKDSQLELYPRLSFSPKDIMKINLLYNYITRRRKLQAFECKKLFKPGNKFNRVKPSPDQMKPRKKPIKYTGEVGPRDISDDEEENAEDDDEDDVNGTKQQSAAENKAAGTHKLSKNYDDNERVQSKKKGHKNNIDVLSLLSDYQTDDERKRNTKMKKKFSYVEEQKLSGLVKEELKFGKPGRGVLG